MNGALASFARRRAISVLPTPVGPIIRMFFGVTSTRSSSGSCMRRQRLRRAIATARLASSWPMIWRLSSWTISRGVMDIVIDGPQAQTSRGTVAATGLFGEILLLNGLVVVGEDADIAGNAKGGLDDFAGRQIGLFQQCAGRRLSIAAAGTHGDQAIFRFDHVTVAGDD